MKQGVYEPDNESVMTIEQSNKTRSLRTDAAAMQTLGSDKRNIDWEAAWREKLDAAEPPTSGHLSSIITQISIVELYDEGTSPFV
jgi:hypothetical protein